MHLVIDLAEQHDAFIRPDERNDYWINVEGVNREFRKHEKVDDSAIRSILLPVGIAHAQHLRDALNHRCQMPSLPRSKRRVIY